MHVYMYVCMCVLYMYAYVDVYMYVWGCMYKERGRKGRAERKREKLTD